MELYDQAMKVQECAGCPADLKDGLCETCPEDYDLAENTSGQCFYHPTPDASSSDEDGDGESSATQLNSN
ncbi:hypothetical protein QOT17_016921 [Balamuthia mandrillaris]